MRRRPLWYGATLRLTRLRPSGRGADVCVEGVETEEELAVARLEPLKQLNMHLASALSVFSLTLLAVPLAVRVGRKETFINAALALGIALGFYVLSAMTAWAKSPSLHPEWLIWLPNGLVLVAALALFRRASRH